MKGYIGITNSDWIEYLQATNHLEAVFWCKKKSFKALCKGEPFYFLRRDNFNSNKDRLILGKASFVKFIRMHSREAWNQFGDCLGYESYEEFSTTIREIYKSELAEIGCIVLDELCFFNNNVSIEQCKVDFSPYIVSGKIINNDECRRINQESGEK